MGMIGRWIDSLADAERDRIIEHPDPTCDGSVWWDIEDGRDCGCLVGCVVGKERANTLAFNAAMCRAVGRDLMADAGFRFADLAELRGSERMWRVVKARAAKANRVEIPAVEEASVA